MSSSEEKKVLVIQERNRERVSKWSIRRFLSETWHYKWWVFGATILVGIGGTLGLEFGYNSSKRNVSSSFSLSVPSAKVIDGGTVGPTFVLYGGEPLMTPNIYSVSSLQALIEENQEFSGLNAETIARYLSFSVEGSVTNGVFTASLPYTFTVTVRSSVFKSFSQAKSFIQKMAERPVILGRTAVSSHSAVSPFYEGVESLDYAAQASLLVEKYEMVKTVYSSLLSTFSSAHLLGDGKTTLGAEWENFRYAHASGSSTDVDVALGEVSSNNYLRFINTSEGRADKIAELKSLGSSFIDNVKKTISDISVLKESYDRLASTTQIVTTETEYSETMLKLNQEISSKQMVLAEYLSSLKRFGYVSGSSKDILEISTASDASAIRLGAGLSECGGYIQHLESPETDDWANACDSFGRKMSSLRSSYKADIERTNATFRFMQSKYAGSVAFSTPSIATESGGLAIWAGAVAGAVFGFVLSALICTFVGIWTEDKKEMKKEEQVK